jgi:hypothetical protein
LQCVQSDIVNWQGDGSFFDAVLLVSTIEHIGLSCCGKDRIDMDADWKAMSKVKSLLKPGGLVVLTTTHCRNRHNDGQRTYSGADLQRLLAGYVVRRCLVAEPLDGLTWTTRSDIPFCSLDTIDSETNKVVLIEATTSPE